MNIALRGKEFSVRQQEKVGQVYELLELRNCNRENHSGGYLVEYAVPHEPGCNIWIRPLSSDWKVKEQIFQIREYQPVVDLFPQFFSEKPRRIIDCGANIGLTSVWFHCHYPEASITAIEPFEENFRLLEKNFTANRMNGHTIIHGGVWNKDARLQIDRSFRDGKEWSIALKEAENGQGDISGICIKSLICRQQGLTDILKIDIEGAESRLFEDSAYAKEFLQSVKCLVIEIHDELQVRDKIYKHLAACKFIIVNLGETTIAINRSHITV